MTIVARRAARRWLAALAAVLLATAACSSSPTATADSPGSGTGGPGATASPAAGRPCSPKGPAVTADGWRGRAFYEVFVRSFADSDGDGIGDLAGLTARLDYLNDGDPTTTDDLGVTGIWLMPVAEAASYHGYDVVDYTAIETDYGKAADLRAFIDAAHERGIAVIVDFVINHTSRDHPWFQDALAGGEHRDWYIWADENPGWPPVAGPSPWHAAPNGEGYYYGAFWEGMPDLNLRNPEVVAELERVAAFWLTELDVDGFRIDAAKHLIEDGPDAQVNTNDTRAWLKSFRDAVHRVDPDALVLGEVWDARGMSSLYVTDGSLDMAFDFVVGPALLNGVYNGAATLLSSLEEVATRYGPGLAGTFLSNHDQPRVMSQLRGDVAAARQAAEALLTGPGVPFVYYGEELGLTGAKPDERIRTPLPWTAAAPGHGFTTGMPWEAFTDGATTTNVEAAASDPESLLAAYRELIRLRSAHPTLAIGAFDRVGSSDRAVGASLRSAGIDSFVLVVQNLSSEPVAAAALQFDVGPLCGTPVATLLYPAGSGVVPTSPTVSAEGGFAGYVPVAELPARATLVIDLSP